MLRLLLAGEGTAVQNKFLIFSESSLKLLNVLLRRLPIGIAGIAVKLERTSAQCRLKLIASEGDRLVVIIGARYVEFGRCGHSLCTSLKEEQHGSEDVMSMGGLR